jgi:MFS family permease
VFLPIAALPEAQLLTWGWRIPFLLSAVVVGAGYIIRRRLEETPAFEAEAAHGEVPKTPLAYLFKYHWRGVLRVMFAAFIAMINTLYTVFALTFATSATYGNGFSSNFMLWVAIVANLIAIAIIPFWARLSDKVGRKPIFVTGAIGSAILAVAYLAAIASKNGVLVWTIGLLLAGVVYSKTNAVWPATYAEYFPTNVRLSGMAIGTQFGFGLAGFTPTIAAALAGTGSDGWSRVAIVAALACAISAIAVATGPKKTHLIPTTELGQQDSTRTVGTTGALRTS